MTVAGVTVRKRFAFRVGSLAALAGPRARSAATAGPLRYGTLGCQPPDQNAYNPFFKTLIAWSPEVAAVDLTTGTDAEYVWWITRVWEFDGADVLNGTGWYPYGWEEWHYAYADDAHWARDWVGIETGVHRAGMAWSFIEGQKAQAVENWVYYSSTGAWTMFMSSHADASPAYCSTGGYLGRFQ